MNDRASEKTAIPEWLEAARHGSREALGAALNACRNYLLLVANQQLDPDVQGKIGPSDLVQESFLEAQRDFGQFQGTSEEELLAWLRRILLNNLANASRHYKEAGKRNVAFEVPFAEVPARSCFRPSRVKRIPPAAGPWPRNGTSRCAGPWSNCQNRPGR